MRQALVSPRNGRRESSAAIAFLMRHTCPRLCRGGPRTDPAGPQNKPEAISYQCARTITNSEVAGQKTDATNAEWGSGDSSKNVKPIKSMRTSDNYPVLKASSETKRAKKAKKKCTLARRISGPEPPEDKDACRACETCPR